MGRVSAADHEKHARERRDTILSAALRVFAQTGFAEATMDQVAAAADLSKAALYLYFPSKDALLEKLLCRYTLLPELPARVMALRDSPPAEALPKLIAEVWRLLLERKELAHVIVRDIQSNPERAKLLTDRGGLPVSKALAAYLDHWMKQGVLRCQHPLASAQCLFGMLWFFFQTQELAGGKDLYPLSDQTIINSVTRTFLDGLATRSADLVRRGGLPRGKSKHQEN
jgi:AcrR family transcriptional regulator